MAPTPRVRSRRHATGHRDEDPEHQGRRYIFINQLCLYLSPLVAGPMARQRRHHVPGYITHVMARGIDGMPVFRDDRDRGEFLRRLGRGLARSGFRCLAWSLMPNHYHLLIRTVEYEPAYLLRPLNGGYAAWYNRRHARRGYLFQDRYKSLVCQEMSYALELVRYVHLNPVRAGLVRALDGLKDYHWCGHRALLGDMRDCAWQSVDEVLGRFAPSRAAARRAYMAFLREGLGEGTGEGDGDSASWTLPDRDGSAGDVRGDADFVRRALLRETEIRRRQTALRASGWDLETLLRSVCEHYGVDHGRVTRRGYGNALSQARGAIAYLAWKELGIPFAETGRRLGVSPPCASLAAERARHAAVQAGGRLEIEMLSKRRAAGQTRSNAKN
jgi:putative transposase